MTSLRLRPPLLGFAAARSHALPCGPLCLGPAIARRPTRCTKRVRARLRVIRDLRARAVRPGEVSWPSSSGLATAAMLLSSISRTAPDLAGRGRGCPAAGLKLATVSSCASSASSRVRFSSRGLFTRPSLDLVVEGRPMCCVFLDVDSNEMQQLVRERNPTRRSRVRSARRRDRRAATLLGILISASVRKVPNFFNAMIRLRRTTTSDPPTSGAIATREKTDSRNVFAVWAACAVACTSTDAFSATQ